MIGKRFVILNRILETLEIYFNDKNEEVNSDGMNESSDWREISTSNKEYYIAD